MNKNNGYVTGFLGRRDGFQIPIALSEAGILDRFVTGICSECIPRSLSGLLPATIRKTLSRRYCPQISSSLIECRPTIEILQNASKWLGDRQLRSWAWSNKAMSCAVRDVAMKLKSDLVLYEPYAAEAFRAKYRHEPRKVLFHFHLHPVFERRLLDEDDKSFASSSSNSWLRQDAQPENDRRITDLWRQADLVLVASSFTKASLIDQGMPPDKCLVVPYGIESTMSNEINFETNEFNVLYVGSGTQRKGIHHLLEAWKNARLPSGSSLTLVCRYMDPALNPLLPTLPKSVRIFRGVSADFLTQLFKSSALFVMPSILEGFGHVYLESLSLGCPVLGTRNTCLPDLGNESNGIFLTPVGNIEALKKRLEELSEVLTSSAAIELRRRAIEHAKLFTWARFRSSITSALLS